MKLRSKLTSGAFFIDNQTWIVIDLLTVTLHMPPVNKEQQTGLFIWSPYGIGQVIIFLPCGFFLLSFFLSSPKLSGRRLDVYHTSTHDVALVRI